MNIDKLNEFEFFKKIIKDNYFLEEDLKINFNIDPKLIEIAHNLQKFKNCYLNLSEIIQIYDYLNYLIPINIENTITCLINHYKMEKNDQHTINLLDDHNYGELKKKLKYIFDETKTIQYKQDIKINDLINKIQYYINNPVYEGTIRFWFCAYEVNDLLCKFIKSINDNHDFINIELCNTYIDKIIVKSTYRPKKKIIYKLCGFSP